MAKKNESEKKTNQPPVILHAGFLPPKDEDVPDVLKRTPRSEPETRSEEVTHGGEA